MNRLMVVLTATASVLALATTVGASGKIGADCVKPLDLQTANQDLSNCNLKGVTIDGNLPDPGSTPLYGSNLSGANLAEAIVTGGYKPLQFADLSGANLSGATLRGGANEFALLQSANLTNANLRGANIAGLRPLSATNLTNANLNHTNVTGIDALQDAIFSNTTCPDGSNSDANGGTCLGTAFHRHLARSSGACDSCVGADVEDKPERLENGVSSPVHQVERREQGTGLSR